MRRFIRPFQLFITYALIFTSFVHASPSDENLTSSKYLQKIEQAPLILSNHVGKPLNPLNESAYELLNQATQSILMMTFSISDSQVLSILNLKAEEGVDIQLLIDRDHMDGLQDKLHPSIRLATRQTGEGHLHHKILVVDKRYIWLGSANFTQDGFLGSRNVAIAYCDPNSASLLHEEAFFIASHEERADPTPLVTRFGDQTIELYVLPHNQPHLPRPVESKMNEIAKLKLIDLIDGAKEKIQISVIVWTFKDASRALIRAYRRGVEVEVVTGNLNEEAIQLLTKEGIPVKKGSHHQKWMLVDNRILLNGSPNWTMNAFSRSDESFLVYYNLSPEHQALMDSIWKNVYGK